MANVELGGRFRQQHRFVIVCDSLQSGALTTAIRRDMERHTELPAMGEACFRSVRD
jgi:hypothetical protein